MRILVPLFLLLAFAVQAEESAPATNPGHTVSFGFSDVGDLGFGAELGLGYTWASGRWLYRLNYLQSTTVDDDSDRFRTERRTLLFYTETVCRDTETGNLTDLDECSASESFYSPSLEAMYTFPAGSLGLGFRAGRESSPYLFYDSSTGKEGFFFQVKAAPEYYGVSIGYAFGTFGN